MSFYAIQQPHPLGQVLLTRDLYCMTQERKDSKKGVTHSHKGKWYAIIVLNNEHKMTQRITRNGTVPMNCCISSNFWINLLREYEKPLGWYLHVEHPCLTCWQGNTSRLLVGDALFSTTQSRRRGSPLRSDLQRFLVTISDGPPQHGFINEWHPVAWAAATRKGSDDIVLCCQSVCHYIRRQTQGLCLCRTKYSEHNTGSAAGLHRDIMRDLFRFWS